MRIFAIIGLLTVAGATFGVAACQPATRSNSQENAATAEPAPTGTLPIADEPIDREQLLRAVASAASAAALRHNDAEEQQALDGKPFEVRIRFGCPGASTTEDGAAPFSVRFDPGNRTLRVRADPDLTLDDQSVAAIAGNTVEAVEGFWMYRPWLLAAGCPVAQPTADVTAAARVSTEQRVGIAQFFTETDSRTDRRDNRPYEATKLLPESEQLSAVGYNLVLSGRLRQLGQGKVISCRPTAVDAAPECIVSVAIDRVQIEKPDTSVIIAEWSR